MLYFIQYFIYFLNILPIIIIKDIIIINFNSINIIFIF